MRSQYEENRQRRRNEERIPKRRKAPPGTKWCNRCKNFHPLNNFPKGTSKKGGLAAWCKPCASLYMYERRLETVWGLTLADYQELMRLQNGRCAVCQRAPDPRRRLAVDHDHLTGQIRGLLCVSCNRHVIGYALDSPSLLRRAANYLERPPFQTGLAVTDLDELTEVELERQIEMRVAP
jgi:RNA polymerase-binding transcription factor DksA